MSHDLSGGFGLSPLHEYWATRPFATAWRGCGSILLPDEVVGSQTEVAAFGSSAAFADMSSRALWSIEGADTVEFLGALCGENPDSFRPGEARAILWCDAAGLVRGTGRVVVFSGEKAALATASSDAAWLSEAAQPFAVRVSITQSAAIRLAGPLSKAALEAGGIAKRNGCHVEVPGLGSVLAMAPIDGAMDFWCGPEEAVALAWVLERAGACPAGVQALDAWQIANGLLQAGRDWVPAQAAVDRSVTRRRPDLTHGGYLVAAWDTQPPSEVRNAVFWPAAAQYRAIMWAPQRSGRQPAAPGNGHYLGAAATD